MTDPDPLTEPKKKPSRAKKIRDGLSLVVIGVIGFVLFLVINAVHVRIIPLAAISIILMLAGIGAVFLAFSKDDKK